MPNGRVMNVRYKIWNQNTRYYDLLRIRGWKNQAHVFPSNISLHRSEVMQNNSDSTYVVKRDYLKTEYGLLIVLAMYARSCDLIRMYA